MMQDIIQMALARGCQEAEVFEEKLLTTVVEYSNNRLKKVETAESHSVTLRVKKEGRLGFSTSTKPGDGAGLTERAIQAASLGRLVEFSFAAPGTIPAVESLDPLVEDLAVEEMVARGKEVVEALRALHPAFLASSRVAKSTNEVTVLNSRGLSGHYRRTGYSHSAGGRLVEGQNFLHVGEAHQSARHEDVSPALVEAIRWSFEKARNNVPLVSGKYQVILTPRATAAVLGPVLASLNGQALERGVSPFVAKQGQTLFDPRISLEDDALLPWGPGSRAMDDEGVPARRKPLVERGTIRNFFLDLATAQALGEEPNGSARRTAGIPAPGPTNLLMLPGERSYGEMIGSLGQGFLIDMLMGAWAGNPYGGSVSGNVMLGYKIEDGQVVGRIKDTMCSVNAFQALKEQVVELSRERKWESAGGPNAPGGSLYLPYLWLDGVSISTRQG